MSPTLRVTLVQAELAWHDPEANRRRFEQLLTPLAGQTDLVVLPEMFTTGFTMAAASVAEPADGPTVDWLRIDGGANSDAIDDGQRRDEQDGNAHFNRLIWMQADGTSRVVRQAPPVPHGARARALLGGRRVACSSSSAAGRSVRWSATTCVFPCGVVTGSAARAGYDVLVYVANWPERRRYAWQTLLRARAIENLCYCIGVNRVGKDGNDMSYTGDSAAIDFLGQPMTSAVESEFVQTVTLERAALESVPRQVSGAPRCRRILASPLSARTASHDERSDPPQSPAGGRVPPDNRPLVAPIYQSVKFTFDDVAQSERQSRGEREGFQYSRVSNPTLRQLELTLAQLQGRDACLLTASGVAAVNLAMLSLCKQGDHVVLFAEMYQPTRYMIRRILSRYGIAHTMLSIEDTDAIERTLASTPDARSSCSNRRRNPVLKVADIERITAAARAHGALTVLDNTFAGFHNHGQFDIDVYVHSLTKYASGHGDVMGGAVIARSELIDCDAAGLHRRSARRSTRMRRS